MDLSRPSASITPTLDGPILGVLAGTTRPLTGREVSRLAGARSHGGVQSVLHRMVDAGLVDVVDAGAARLYTLNREHVAAAAATALLDLRGQLFDRIRHALTTWAVAPVAAAVFGSAARGDGGVASDVDILLVRPTAVDADERAWADAVDELAHRIRRWSGNPAGIIQATPAEVAAMVERREPIVDALRSEAIALTRRRVLDVGQAAGR